MRDANSMPVQGRTVYFRVIDPKDSAGYAGNPQTGDNKDQDDTQSGTITVTQGTSNIAGLVETTLIGTDRYAGDNYQIDASFESFNNPNTCVSDETPTITAWKRVYIEKEKMYKRGGLLRDDFRSSNCSPNCNKIRVYPWADISLGDSIVIFSEQSVAGETAVIQGLQNNPNGWISVTFTGLAAGI